MEISKEIVKDIIQSRESTFVNGLLEGGKIDDSVIESILENAIWAPSHGLGQVWDFKVFAGQGVVSFFNKMQEIYKYTTASDKYRQEKYEGYPSKANKVSHIIAIIARRDPRKKFPKLEDIVSTSCAIQNIYLSLGVHGVAGYLSTGDICYTQATREYLQLGDEDECLGFFQLGIKDTSKSGRQRKRIPAKEKTVWVRE